MPEDEFDFNQWDEITEEELITLKNSLEEIGDYIVDAFIDLTQGLYLFFKKTAKNIASYITKMIEESNNESKD